MILPQLVLLAPQTRPLAYLDPGSGSIVLQVLLAGLMAVGIIIKVFWKKIKGIFTRSTASKDNDRPSEP